MESPESSMDAPVESAEPADSTDLGREMLARARVRSRRGALSGRSTKRRPVTGQQISAAGPDERDPQPLDQVVERLVAERGWQTNRAIGGVEGRWSQIVGQEVAAHCAPENFTDGQLTVRAESTAWASEIKLLATSLLARLNEDLGAGTVTGLRVVGPAGPSWKKGKWSVQGRGPRDTYG